MRRSAAGFGVEGNGALPTAVSGDSYKEIGTSDGAIAVMANWRSPCGAESSSRSTESSLPSLRLTLAG
jgi:hypothetical protein